MGERVSAATEEQLQATGLSEHILNTYRLAHAEDPPLTDEAGHEILAERLDRKPSTMRVHLSRVDKHLKVPREKASPSPPRTEQKLDPDDFASMLVGMSAQGVSAARISRDLGLSPKVASRVGSLLEKELQPLKRELTDVKLEDLTRRFGTLTRDAIDAITPAKLEAASARDLTVAAGIATDKWQLLRGQPTQRMEIGDRRNLNEIVQIILKEAKRRNVEIDITPEGGVTAGKSKFRGALHKKDLKQIESGDPVETLAPA